MPYGFLTDTYATERMKTLEVWSMFHDDDLSIRPPPRLCATSRMSRACWRARRLAGRRHPCLAQGPFPSTERPERGGDV